MSIPEAADAELRRLRARVYGPDRSEPVSADEVTRLEQLERMRFAPASPEPSRVGMADPMGETSPEQSTDAAPKRPGWHARLMVAAAVLTALGVGVGVGFALGSERPLAVDPLPARVAEYAEPVVLPELQRPQTNADRIDAADAAGVDGETTRFIARADGYDVYIARALEEEGVCLIIFDSASTEVPTTACSDGADVGVTVTPNLDIGVGGSRAAPRGGLAERLSESVTAYRR